MKKLVNALAILLLATSASAWEFMFSPLGWNVDLDMYGLPGQATGLRLGKTLVVSPYLECMYGYDSNTSLASKSGRTGSSAITTTAGATVAYTSLSLNTSLSGNLYYSMDRYQRAARDNRDSYGFQFSQRHGTPSGWSFTLSEGYVKGMGSSYLNGMSANRDTMSLGLGVGRSSPASLWTYSGNAAYERTSYASQYFNQNDAVTAGLSLGRAISVKTMVNLSGGWSYRTSKNTDSITGYNFMAGMSSRLMPKTTYNISAGMNYSRSANGWSNWGASYNMGAGWKISPKWSASLHGSTWLQPSEIASPYSGTVNYVSLYNTLGAGVNFIPVRKVSTTTQVLYRRGQYKSMDGHTASALNNCVDDLYMVRFAASYALSRYLSLVASTQYQTVFSDLKQKEYDEYSASLGLRLKY